MSIIPSNIAVRLLSRLVDFWYPLYIIKIEPALSNKIIERMVLLRMPLRFFSFDFLIDSQKIVDRYTVVYCCLLPAHTPILNTDFSRETVSVLFPNTPCNLLMFEMTTEGLIANEQ